MRGRFKHPIRRNVTSDATIFEICSALDLEYSDVFYAGYQSLLSKKLVSGDTTIGLASTSILDKMIADLDQEVKELTKKYEILSKIRSDQVNLTTIPEGKREMSIIFQELAKKHLTQEEIAEYHRAAKARINDGRSNANVAKSVFNDIRSRANGSGAILKEIEKEKGAFMENLVWDFLKGEVSQA